MAIYVSKDKLDSYRLNLLLIHDTYTNNEEMINRKVNAFLKKYNDYNKLNNDKNIDSNLGEYLKISISYSLFETGITQMYHLFEQFLKIYFNINLEKDFKNTSKIANRYDYDLTKNEYYELVDKYRLLNNAIKHGGIYKLENAYFSLINQNDNNDDYGTIMDDKLNITENELNECCVCLYKFVDEMNAFFQDMGFVEEEV